MFEPYKWIKSSSAIGGAGSPKDFQLSESSTCIIPSHRVDITNCASGVLAATQYLFADRKTWNWNSFGWSHILSCFSLPGCISTKISCCALRVCTKSARSSGQSKRPKRMKEWMLLGQGDMFEVLVKIYEVHHGKVRTQWGYIYIIYMNIYIYVDNYIHPGLFFRGLLLNITQLMPRSGSASLWRILGMTPSGSFPSRLASCKVASNRHMSTHVNPGFYRWHMALQQVDSSPSTSDPSTLPTIRIQLAPREGAPWSMHQ